MSRLRNLLFITVMIVSLFLTGNGVHADDMNDTEYVTVQLEGITVGTEYLTSEVYAEAYETFDEIGYKFVEYSSGNVLEELSSTKLIAPLSQRIISPMASGTYLKEFHSKIYLTHKGKSAVFSSDVILELYHYNNFRQINKYHTGTLRAESSGRWTIESPLQAVTSMNGKWPTPSVQVRSSGTATIQVSSATSAGFSLEFLKSVGFNISSSTTENTYVRKYISKTYTISLY